MVVVDAVAARRLVTGPRPVPPPPADAAGASLDALPRAHPVLLLLVVLAGCGGADDGADKKKAREADESAIATDTLALQRATAELGGLGRAFFSAVSGKPELPEDDVPSRLGIFSPPGCASLEKVAAGELRVTFSGCSGAHVRDLQGTLDVRFRQGDDGGWRVDLTSPSDGSLTVGGRPLVVSSTARVRVLDDATRLVTVSAGIDTTTPAGQKLVLAHELDLRTEDDGCVSASGKGTAQVGGRGRTTITDGVSVCPGECPRAGTWSATSLDTKRTVTLRFDGAKSAHAVGKNGRTFEVPLACE